MHQLSAVAVKGAAPSRQCRHSMSAQTSAYACVSDVVQLSSAALSSLDSQAHGRRPPPWAWSRAALSAAAEAPV